MLNLKELQKVINYLNKLKKEEEEKAILQLAENIKNEILLAIENELLNFESQEIENFKNNIKDNMAYDFNVVEILETIKNKIFVSVWEV